MAFILEVLLNLAFALRMGVRGRMLAELLHGFVVVIRIYAIRMFQRQLLDIPHQHVTIVQICLLYTSRCVEETALQLREMYFELLSKMDFYV